MSKNYLYNLLLSIVNILFPIISFPYASRVLGPEGIGKVQFILSFSQYFALIASFGIPIYGLKEIAKHKFDENKRSVVFSELIIIYFLTSLLLSIFYLASIFTFPYFNFDRSVYLAAILVVFLGFSSIDWLYSGLEEFKGIALRSILVKILSLVFLYLFVDNRSDYRVYLYIMMFSLLGNNVLSLFMIGGRVKLLFVNLNLRQHFTPLFYIFSTTLAVSMYTVLDTILLGFMSDEKAVGLYTAAVKLTKITLPFVTSLGVILIPKIANEFAVDNLKEVQNLLSKSLTFIIFFSIPITLGLFMLAPEFISIFSGEEFKSAILSMQILSVLPLIIGLGHFFLFLILVPGGKNKEMLFSVAGGVIVGLLLNILLIPLWREVGSSVANVCSELVVTLAYFYFVKRHYAFTYDWLMILKAFACSLLFIPLILMLRTINMNTLFVLLSSISICTIVYVMAQWYLFKNHFVSEITHFIKVKLAFRQI